MNHQKLPSGSFQQSQKMFRGIPLQSETSGIVYPTVDHKLKHNNFLSQRKTANKNKEHPWLLKEVRRQKTKKKKFCLKQVEIMFMKTFFK